MSFGVWLDFHKHYGRWTMAYTLLSTAGTTTSTDIDFGAACNSGVATLDRPQFDTASVPGGFGTDVLNYDEEDDEDDDEEGFDEDEGDDDDDEFEDEDEDLEEDDDDFLDDEDDDLDDDDADADEDDDDDDDDL